MDTVTVDSSEGATGRTAGVVGSTDVAPEALEQYRRELTGYCYRMLGSASEAEDAVQDTMTKAWKAADRFEGRSSARSWLYRIATNVCVDMQRSPQRRARPMELRTSSPPDPAHLADVLPEHAWITPVADDRVISMSADPADAALARDSIRLAFVAALQHLPARQRASLILCEVLGWQAAEVAELLDTTPAAVNSALQRARATLAERPASVETSVDDPQRRALLERFVDAFERYDVDAIVGLLHDDAVQSMPPYAMWIEGSENIGAWLLGPGIGCEGSRLVATNASGCPAFGQYRVDPEGGFAPWGLQVLEITGDRISGYHNFLDTDTLFPLFGLPAHLD